jgi:hypothetical protein
MLVLYLYVLFALAHAGHACAPPSKKVSAIAVLIGRNADGSPLSGTVQFTQASYNDPVVITVDIAGVVPSPTLKHGLHVHTNGITVVSPTNITASKLLTFFFVQVFVLIILDLNVKLFVYFKNKNYKSLFVIWSSLQSVQQSSR